MKKMKEFLINLILLIAVFAVMALAVAAVEMAGQFLNKKEYLKHNPGRTYIEKCSHDGCTITIKHSMF